MPPIECFVIYRNYVIAQCLDMFNSYFFWHLRKDSSKQYCFAQNLHAHTTLPLETTKYIKQKVWMALFEDKYRFIVKCIAEDGFWMQWRPRLIIRFAELGMDGIAYKDET